MRRLISALAFALVATPFTAHAQWRPLGSGTAGSASGEPEHEGSRTERVEWMQRDRAYPSAESSISAVQRARAASIGGSSALAAVVSSWRNIGPFGFQMNGFFGSSPQADGGRVLTTAFHPSNPNIMYTGTAGGGVWKTTNGGLSWLPLTDNSCSLASSAIALDPVDPNIIYVGTGEPTQSAGCGLLRSFNGGASWTEIRSGGIAPAVNVGNSVFRIVVDPGTAGSQSSTVVLYATTQGLFRSSNSGTTWTRVLGSASTNATDVRADPAQDGVFWAALGTNNDNAQNGLWKSTDRGVTWSRVYAAPAGSRRAAVAVSPASPRKVWVVFSTASNSAGESFFSALVRYDDAAGTGTVVSANGLYGASRGDFGNQLWYDLVLEAHPTDPNVLFLGGTRLYRSLNGGQDFDIVAYNTHVDWHSLQFSPSDPSIIAGGCDGGIHVSFDAGQTFLSRNSNIVATQFYPGLAVHPTLADVLVGGLQDNSTLIGFGSSYWTYVSSGDGGPAAFNPMNPNVFFTSCQNVFCVFRAVRSPTGGALQVTSFSHPLPSTERKRFLAPMVKDPSDSLVLYYGTYRLVQSVLTSNTTMAFFSTIDLTKGTGVINAITIAPSDNRVIWVGTSDGNVQIVNGSDGSATLRTAGLPNASVTDIAVDPLNPDRAIVTYSGFSAQQRAYLTTDRGVTWTNISSNLPSLPMNAAVILPGSNRFFVAGDIGIYETTDAGATWSNAFPGMPNVIINDLVYQPVSGNLYAATYGRGVWSTTLSTGDAVLRGDVNRDGSVNAFDVMLVQQAILGVIPGISSPPYPNGDANCNGRVDSGDALAIAQFAVGSAPAALCVGKMQ